MVMQYRGFRLLNKTSLHEKYQTENAYTQMLGVCPNNHVDIPKGFEDVAKYNGTLAHKTNFGFDRNVYVASVSFLFVNMISCLEFLSTD